MSDKKIKITRPRVLPARGPSAVARAMAGQGGESISEALADGASKPVTLYGKSVRVSHSAKLK